ncbi:hypothetical protein K431DRAFT_290618 [Polychaeton citri CBS 116435]|uniref:Secreted protein CSS2 C-terminal domain-containing protein n=1 Tax=Polychaeton citri CBS 116435 TaxID=1314669 RepID=A0A9P4QIH4_9PEZI|nr:hypothetical protein K431DRAFT_290618 [Polychaeton citri CBS 116435]
MHLSTLAALIAATSALGLTASTTGNNIAISEAAAFASPNGWADINLVDLASEGLSQTSSPGNCEPLDEITSGTLATLLKRHSDSNTCRTSSASVDSVAFSFTTGPSDNCKTTAEEGTIQGGLNRYFDYLGNQICGVHCVPLDHGGTYRAYITLGPTGSNLNSISCTSSAVYVDCGIGGQNDS